MIGRPNGQNLLRAWTTWTQIGTGAEIARNHDRSKALADYRFKRCENVVATRRPIFRRGPPASADLVRKSRQLRSDAGIAAVRRRTYGRRRRSGGVSTQRIDHRAGREVIEAIGPCRA